MRRIASQYRPVVTTTKFMTQVAALSYSDPEMQESVENEVARAEGGFVLMTENPCHDPQFYCHGYRLCELSSYVT